MSKTSDCDRMRLIGGLCMFIGGTLYMLNAVLFGDCAMTDKDWIQIGVTILGFLITFLGVIFGAVIPLFRDGKSIDEIKKTASGDLKPKVDSIEKMAAEQSSGIKDLVTDLEVRKQMLVQYPQGAAGKALIEQGINQLQAQYDDLNKRYAAEQEKNVDLKIKNSELSQKVERLSDENKALRAQLNHLKQQNYKRKNPVQDLDLSM